MKKILLFLLVITSTYSFSQTQIGSDINGLNIGDQFGNSISLNSSGNIVAIGGYENDNNGSNSGHVRIFENVGGVWTQIGNDINGISSSDRFGTSVSLNSSGNIVAIGAYLNDENGSNSGQVRIFENEGGIWTQVGNSINGEFNQDYFGSSVSLNSSGNIVAISSPNNNNGSNSIGHVRIFQNVSGSWVQLGNDIDAEIQTNPSGGTSIFVNINSTGNIVAVGNGPNNNENGDNAGHVRIFENISDVWTQIGDDINGENGNDYSGLSLDLNNDGDIVAISSLYNDDNGQNSGQVRIYENIGGAWIQKGADINGISSGDYFGSYVALNSNGNTLAVSSSNNGDNEDVGYVYIYEYLNNHWEFKAMINGEGSGDRFGLSLSFSHDGDILAIGAPSSASFASAGYARIFNLSDALSLNDFEFRNIKLFPNPVYNQFTIELKDTIELEKVSIYNQLGQLVKTSREVTTDVRELSSGLYFVEVLTDLGKSSQKLIIK